MERKQQRNLLKAENLIFKNSSTLLVLEEQRGGSVVGKERHVLMSQGTLLVGTLPLSLNDYQAVV